MKKKKTQTGKNSFVLLKGEKEQNFKSFERLLDNLVEQYGAALERGEKIVLVASVNRISEIVKP